MTCLAVTLIKTDRHVNHDDETWSVPLSVKLGNAMATALLPGNSLLRTVPSIASQWIGGGTGIRSGFQLFIKNYK